LDLGYRPSAFFIWELILYVDMGAPKMINIVCMSSPLPPKNNNNETAEDRPIIDWGAIARDPDFSILIRRKLNLIIPATVFFIIYYFALPIGVGWFPDFMMQKIWGDLNLAYAFAFSQFFMSWALAFVYVFAAAGWDRRQNALLAKFGYTSKN